MSDRFHPISMEQLTDWIFTELERKDSVFGISRAAVFVPRPSHPFRRRESGAELETPFGVAAGPHTQMAQNIVVAWLTGARVIELKTVQDLDELDVHKPCIDVTDEGYNVEWSQELRVHESFDEYLRAWVLIHALHRALGFPGDRPGVLFNMSVGYDLAGIRGPKVQWYLNAMTDASAWLPAYVDIVARRCPSVREIEVPDRLSDSVTLSTMHGCPPDEIERISLYLLEDRGLHTQVKCNPTLLGPELVRGIVNDELGFGDVPIPDAAFGHDLRYEDAVPMFERLRRAAEARGVGFGLKLSNTLEVENWRTVFDRDATMYLSGRALHPVTVNLASQLAEEFGGALPLSFAGGADCFNVADLLAGGVRTVTVCSDLLKTGGYLRLLQYSQVLEAAIGATGAGDLDGFVRRTAEAGGLDAGGAPVADCARFNLRRYADQVRTDWRYRKVSFRTDRSKTRRALGAFDCIEAPCVDECPVDQAVPRYMRAVRSGDLDKAVRITRLDNPLPAILGRVCDHLCENTCIRTHLDQPLAIRQMKRFIMEHEARGGALAPPRSTAARVAIIGAGPAGLAAAGWLARAGVGVTILEEQPYPGGMVGGAIPAYRLPGVQIEQDLGVLARLGVEIHYGVRAGVDVTLDGLRADGFAAVFVAVGAQRGRRLGLPGEDAEGVLDGVTFLRGVREGRPAAIGPRVGVVGAGDTAMDCARAARRLGATAVSIVYRRTVDQMPADPEEIHAIREEGIGVVELARPVGLRVEGGRLAGLRCVRTEYRGDRDAAGRKAPHDVPGSEFEIGLDTLVLAISQHAVLDLFGDASPALTPAGFIAVDPETLETSIPGVYAGGDVAGDGPSSIVRAAADGKRVAAAVAARLGVVMPAASEQARVASLAEVPDLMVRRARREYRVPIRSSPLDRRDGFEETVLGYTEEEAAREAARCLDCDRICSLCVGVCPNMALMTYEVTHVRADLPVLRAGAAGTVVADGVEPFTVDQGLQIAVLADFCNECGNCVTACPTSGRPYVDKPRLYLDRADFEAERDNAFMLLGGDAIEGRFDGATHRVVVVDGRVEYEATGVRATLDRETFGLVGAPPDGAVNGRILSLRPAAVMATLLTGVTDSLPHVPIAAAGRGSRLAPPDYGE
ncbi:MAG: Glutamate synthase small chain [Chloroflexi bacterium]|nr:Glutamate synthase small chain [Chloroflexota bacterium]